MNPLLRYAVKKVDTRCRAFEAASEAGHRVPDHVQEYLDMPLMGLEAFRWKWTFSGLRIRASGPFLSL